MPAVSAPTREATAMRSLCTAARESPCAATKTQLSQKLNTQKSKPFLFLTIYQEKKGLSGLSDGLSFYLKYVEEEGGDSHKTRAKLDSKEAEAGGSGQEADISGHDEGPLGAASGWPGCLVGSGSAPRRHGDWQVLFC